LETATGTEPAVVRSLSSNVIWSWVVLTKVVLREDPFQVAEEAGTNPLPITVRTLPASSTVTVPGVTDETRGAGLLTMNSAAADAPPPGAGFFTVISAVPAIDRSVEVSVIFNCVVLTKVVTRLFWFHSALEPWTNPVPLMVTVVAASPVVAPEGDMEVMLGVGLF
jgi:hypothetical protein